MFEKGKKDYLDYFHNKYDYVDYKDLEMTYEIAKERLLNTLFPFNDDIEEVPSRYKMKIVEVMEEIIDTGNMRHYTSYRENGVSWTRASSVTLQSLSDVTPYGG